MRSAENLIKKEQRYRALAIEYEDDYCWNVANDLLLEIMAVENEKEIKPCEDSNSEDV